MADEAVEETHMRVKSLAALADEAGKVQGRFLASLADETVEAPRVQVELGAVVPTGPSWRRTCR